MTVAVLRVALDTPLRRLFDYLPPERIVPPPGTRVRVPFGRQRLVGVVCAHADTSDLPPEKLKAFFAEVFRAFISMLRRSMTL